MSKIRPTTVRLLPKDLPSGQSGAEIIVGSKKAVGQTGLASVCVQSFPAVRISLAFFSTGWSRRQVSPTTSGEMRKRSSSWTDQCPSHTRYTLFRGIESINVVCQGKRACSGVVHGGPFVRSSFFFHGTVTVDPKTRPNAGASAGFHRQNE